MNRETISRSIPVITAALLSGAALAPSAEAKDRYYLIEESYPSTMECVETVPLTTIEKTVTIEKPVLIERSTRTIRTTRHHTMARKTSFKSKSMHIAAKPVRRTHTLARRSTITQKTVQRTIATRPVLVESPVWVEQQNTKPMVIEKAVEVDRPMLVKKHHHLVEFNLF